MLLPQWCSQFQIYWPFILPFFFCLFIYLLLYPWAILKVTGYVFSQETLRWRLMFVRDPNLWKEGERTRIGQEKKVNCNTGLINFGQSPVCIWSGAHFYCAKMPNIYMLNSSSLLDMDWQSRRVTCSKVSLCSWGKSLGRLKEPRAGGCPLIHIPSSQDKSFLDRKYRIFHPHLLYWSVSYIGLPWCLRW